jgi:acylpyruvate hydrolase
VPKAPFFFLKPTSSYLPSGGQVEIPQGIIAHHEGNTYRYSLSHASNNLGLTTVELAVVIGKRGREIKQDEADSYVAGYALSVDMTGRNLQDKVKKAGLPWTAAKGFDTFTPIGFVRTASPHLSKLTIECRSFIPKTSIPDPDNLRITLKVKLDIPSHGGGQSAEFCSRSTGRPSKMVRQAT